MHRGQAAFFTAFALSFVLEFHRCCLTVKLDVFPISSLHPLLSKTDIIQFYIIIEVIHSSSSFRQTEYPINSNRSNHGFKATTFFAIMKNPVNRIVTAAPRALDSILSGSQENKKKQNKNQHHHNQSSSSSSRERTCSFDLDLSGLKLLDSSSNSLGGGGGSSTLGGSIAEEGSVVTSFEDLSELKDLSLDNWKMEDPSPN